MFGPSLRLGRGMCDACPALASERWPRFSHVEGEFERMFPNLAQFDSKLQRFRPGAAEVIRGPHLPSLTLVAMSYKPPQPQLSTRNCEIDCDTTPRKVPPSNKSIPGGLGSRALPDGARFKMSASTSVSVRGLRQGMTICRQTFRPHPAPNKPSALGADAPNQHPRGGETPEFALHGPLAA